MLRSLSQAWPADLGFPHSLLKRLETPRYWVWCQLHMFSSSFSFLLMKEAIAQIIWKGKSGICYLGVPLPCCSYKFKLRFLRIRLNMTKIAVWAVELSTCRLIEAFVIMKRKGSRRWVHPLRSLQLKVLINPLLGSGKKKLETRQFTDSSNPGHASCTIPSSDTGTLRCIQIYLLQKYFTLTPFKFIKYAQTLSTSWPWRAAIPCWTSGQLLCFIT